MKKVIIKDVGPIAGEYQLDIGDLTIISGPNMSGKSTLARILYALVNATKREEDTYNKFKHELIHICNMGYPNNKNYNEEYAAGVLAPSNSDDSYIKSDYGDYQIQHGGFITPPENKKDLIRVYYAYLIDMFHLIELKKNSKTYDTNLFGLGNYLLLNKDDNKRNKKVCKKIQKLIGGKLYSDCYNIMFNKQLKDCLSYDVDPQYLSTGQLYLGLISYFLRRGVLSKDDFLILDSPDNFISYSWKKKFNEIVWYMVNDGINVVLVTNDADILKYQECMVKENKDYKNRIALNLLPSNNKHYKKWHDDDFDFDDKLAIIKRNSTKVFADYYIRAL